jgi:outer membrane protein assembly factor BamB
LLGGLLLFGLFLTLAVLQVLANRVHRTTNADLLAAFAGAVIEERPVTSVEWPQWRGVHRDGVVKWLGLLADWPRTGPERLWRADGGESYSSFAVLGGRVYTLLSSNNQEQVVCWNAATGEEIWRQGYDRPNANIEYGNWPRSTPTLDGDRIYTVGPSGRFQCRMSADGHLLWEHDLVQQYGGRVPRWGIASSPLVDGNLVIVTPGGADGHSVAAFDKGTGREVWTALNDPPGYSSPIAITVGGERQVVVFTGDSLVGLKADKGLERWRYPWPTEFQVNAATPLEFTAKVNGRPEQFLFITSGYTQGCALLNVTTEGPTGCVVRLVYQSNELCSHFSSPVRYRDHVYGFNETVLTCMDLRTGEVRWKKRGFQKGSLLLAEEPNGSAMLVVLGEEGNLALFAATPEDRPEIAKARPLRRRCWPQPVLAEGRLYIRDEEQILCLKLARTEK